MTAERPPLRHFILTRVASPSTAVKVYLDRLCDYLFTLARFITHQEGHSEIIYRLFVSRLRLPLFRCYLATQPPSAKSRTNLPSDLRQPNDPRVMPVIDTSQLSEAEQMYIKRFEERHMRNVDRRTRERRRARVIGLSFGVLVLAIYIYTIVRVRQETFLDDFSIPEPPPQKKAVEHE